MLLRNPNLVTRFRRYGLVVVVPLLVMLLATPAAAQSDARLGGRVVDADGNPIANATITVYSINRGDSRTIKSNEEGDYAGRGFRIEVYRVRVEAEGYNPQEQDVKLNFGTNVVDATLMVAVAQPDVDFGTLNGLYQTAFAAYTDKDWPLAETAVRDLFDGMGEFESEESITMRKSALEVLAMAILQQGRTDEAIATYEELLALDPDSLPANTWIAQAYASKNDYEGALKYLRRAAELAPDDSSVQYNTGATLVQTGNVEEGIVMIERALELRPDFPLATKTIGFAYAQTGEYAKAVAALNAYLEYAPEDATDRAEIQGMIEALESMI